MPLAPPFSNLTIGAHGLVSTLAVHEVYEEEGIPDNSID